MENNSLEIGKNGENLAAEYLEQNGYEIVARNWRWSRAEIDIIARKKKLSDQPPLHYLQDPLIFIEVKTRSYDYYGNPQEAVTPQKEKLMIDAAYQFALKNNFDGPIRLDIIAIVMKGNGDYHLDHFEDTGFPTFERF